VNRADIPDYGHGRCPNCRAIFDLEKAEPSFRESYGDKGTLIYILCQGCHGQFTSDSTARRKITNECFRNVKQDYIAKKEHPLPWAVTTQLTMALNDFNLVLAIEYGSGLTRGTYFGILTGTHELCILPGGLKIIVSVDTYEENYGRAS